MGSKVIAFDLDDVLCYRESELGGKVNKYKSCKPVKEMIQIANQCYEKGYKVIIYTARGMTGLYGNTHDIYSNLYQLTKEQLKEWGIKHHQLIMGKAHYDLLIDDKAVNSGAIKNLQDVLIAVKDND